MWKYGLCPFLETIFFLFFKFLFRKAIAIDYYLVIDLFKRVAKLVID